MTREDLARIEEAIGRSVPSDLRQLYERYPFAPDSWAAEFGMPDSAEFLIRANTAESVAVDFGLPADNVLQIGSDGGESLYFAYFADAETCVLEVELETGKVSTHVPDLFAWGLYLGAVQERLERDVEVMARRRWWQFWKA